MAMQGSVGNRAVHGASRLAVCRMSEARPCLMRAWGASESDLRRWLLHQLHDRPLAEDLLQDVFLKAMRQQAHFCAISNPRAWIFQVARNALADHLRRRHKSVPLPEDLAWTDEGPAPVDTLANCLPRVLAELSPEDRDVISCCDLEGMTLAAYAKRVGFSLSGAKSRLQRARVRLKQQLASACEVRFDEQGKVCCFRPRPPL